jgi:hypothetical protein
MRRHPALERIPVGSKSRNEHVARKRSLIKLAAAAIERRQSQMLLRIG